MREATLRDRVAELLAASDRSNVPPFMVMDVMSAAEQIEAAGGHVIHMEVGQPAAPAPKTAIAAARAALEGGRIDYTSALGIPSLRERIANHYRETYGLAVANVFHAGDGNLHPLILYDANKPGELERAEAFGADILRLCVEVGGVLTGEHGVGIEKRDLMPEMFSAIDLAQQQRLKCAFDEGGLVNPGKVFPTLHRCAELGRLHVHAGKLPFPDLPRF